MSGTIFGDDTGDIVLQKNYPIEEQDSSGQWKMEFQYVVNVDVAFDEGVLPVHNSVVPTQFIIPGITDNLILTSLKFSVHDMPGYRGLRLVYTLPTSESRGKPVQEGDTTLEGNTTFKEIPIETPGAGAGGVDLSDTEIAELKAKKTFTKAAFQSQFTNTTVQKDNAISEAELISGVGHRSSPIGLDAVADPEKWLLTSKQITTIQGGNRQLRQTWDYDANGWSDLLFDNEAPV